MKQLIIAEASNNSAIDPQASVQFDFNQCGNNQPPITFEGIHNGIKNITNKIKNSIIPDIGSIDFNITDSDIIEGLDW